MKANEALAKIRVMLGMESPAEVETVELAELTLADGTVVRVDGEPAEGKALFVVTEDGEIPAPEGIHETQDGLLITVNAEGVITAIEEAVQAEEQEMSEEPEVLVAEPEETEYSDELISEITNMVKPLLEKLEKIESKFQALDQDFNKFRNEPAADRITNNLTMSTEVIKNHGERQDKRYEALLNIRKNK